MGWRIRRLAGRSRSTAELEAGFSNRADSGELAHRKSRHLWMAPLLDGRTNENGNGLIRRYVGKSTDLSRVTEADLRAIEDRINTKPRRIHKWGTARQIYDQAVAMTG